MQKMVPTWWTPCGEKLESEKGDWYEETCIQEEIGWVPVSYIAKVSVLARRGGEGGINIQSGP